MKKSNKAALISLLVFPGLGHIYLKKYLVGGILAAVAGFSLYYIITDIVAKALTVIDKINSGEIAPDIATITELVTVSSDASSGVSIAIGAIVTCWVISILDSYRLGKNI